MASFFNKPEHRRFNLEPRYWDKSKEEREKRERNAKQELGIIDSNDVYRPNIKGRMKTSLRTKKEENRGLKQTSNSRLFVIFVVLFMLIYGYMLDWDYSILIDKILNLLR